MDYRRFYLIHCKIYSTMRSTMRSTMKMKAITMKMKKYLPVIVVLFIQFRGFSQSGDPSSTDAATDTAFIITVLKHHNTYRSSLHEAPLEWSTALAADALTWAQHLARIDQGVHDQSIRGKEGENLWWGTAGAFTPAEMISFWGNEKKDFVYGIFPDCSGSRSAVVGHYTQIIWKTTTSVGCALVSNKKKDYLVCRYSPAGNMIGAKVY